MLPECYISIADHLFGDLPRHQPVHSSPFLTNERGDGAPGTSSLGSRCTVFIVLNKNTFYKNVNKKI